MTRIACRSHAVQHRAVDETVTPVSLDINCKEEVRHGGNDAEGDTGGGNPLPVAEAAEAQAAEQ